MNSLGNDYAKGTGIPQKDVSVGSINKENEKVRASDKVVHIAKIYDIEVTSKNRSEVVEQIAKKCLFKVGYDVDNKQLVPENQYYTKTASELANTSLGLPGSRARISKSMRVPSRLTERPRCRSASAPPLTTEAKCKTLSAPSRTRWSISMSLACPSMTSSRASSVNPTGST